MKKLIPILFATLAVAFAQQPSPAPEPSPEQLKQYALVVRQQRDQITQAMQEAQAQLTLAQIEIERLNKLIIDLNTKLAAATKPKEEPAAPAANK